MRFPHEPPEARKWSRMRTGDLRVGQRDGYDAQTANVWNGDRWVPERIVTPGPRGIPLIWVWDNKAIGRCGRCEQQVARGEPVYRGPFRPWRSRKDPLVHVKCWDAGRDEILGYKDLKSLPSTRRGPQKQVLRTSS